MNSQRVPKKKPSIIPTPRVSGAFAFTPLSQGTHSVEGLFVPQLDLPMFKKIPHAQHAVNDPRYAINTCRRDCLVKSSSSAMAAAVTG